MGESTLILLGDVVSGPGGDIGFVGGLLSLLRRVLFFVRLGAKREAERDRTCGDDQGEDEQLAPRVIA
jgi:hypothetical protein